MLSSVKKVGVWMDRNSTLVGLLRCFSGTLAWVLYGEAGSDDEDIAQGAFVLSLQEHARHGGIDGEAGEATPGFCESIGVFIIHVCIGGDGSELRK